MVLDIITLLAVSGLIVIMCGVSFVVNASFNRNDPAGRVWSLAFMAGMLATVGYAVEALVASAWWALVVAHMSLAVSVGSMWAGSRLFNGRPSRYWIVGLGGAIAAVASIMASPEAGTWAGSFELYIVIATFASLCSLETYRGRLRRSLNGRVLLIVFLLVTAFYGGRAVAFAVAGPDSEFFSVYFGTPTTTIVNLMLVVVASISMSILRAERGSGDALGDLTRGIHSAAGVLSADAFSQAAADHVCRAESKGGHLALIGAELDKLPDLNVAFGRAAGDRAITAFAEALRRSSPAMAQIGHRGAGGFFVLAAVDSGEDALALAERIQIGMADDPLPEAQQIRVTASFGIALTNDLGYDLDRLTGAVTSAIGAIQSGGGNAVKVAAALV
ncbi:MAG: hypothetical protein JWQ68_107 [Cryobacterium sp.]|jgi:diguanylate cyclase (GGDEF)-like protein|nr:hypothetical protein [Cryobacterium sp.]